MVSIKTRRRNVNLSRRHSRLAAIAVALLLVANLDSFAQGTKKKPPKRKSEPTLSDRLAKARADVIEATKTYKKSLEPVLKLQEDDVKTAAELLDKRRELLNQQIISKKEVEDGERLLADAQAKVNATMRLLAEADTVIAETRAEEQLAKLGPARVGAYQLTGALIRFNGGAQWLLSDAAKIESFFVSKFRRGLPVSAFGQTAVHNQLGFAHHNSIDVAVSPDSAEGQALMSYLRSAGIPFIAFRHAIRGAATGAHIHIGYPSRRLSK